MDDATKTALEAFDSSRSTRNVALFADANEALSKAVSEHDPTCLVIADPCMDATDLWQLRARGVRFVAISSPRQADELYRVIYLAARLVDTGGVVLVLSQGSALKDRPRDAAGEIFLGAYPEFQWAVTRSNALLLRRLA